MDLLQIREKEIFETLNKIKNHNFVLIGGYAVNAYTLPRFSVDCDIVIKDEQELRIIEKELILLDYHKVASSNLNTPYSGNFVRYEKVLESNFKVSIDILIKEVLDRQTSASFSANWVFQNSTFRLLRGKTITDKLRIRIVNPYALFIMKMVSCRSTDIRDLFVLIPIIKNTSWIQDEVSKCYDFNNRFLKLKEKISSKQFKDGLQGVFGYIDENLFEKHKSLILKLGRK